jgi:UDP-glucose 4-epimerase
MHTTLMQPSGFGQRRGDDVGQQARQYRRVAKAESGWDCVNCLRVEDGDMRIVVTGATGNLGTSVLAAATADPDVESILGLARRRPGRTWPKAEFAPADIAVDDLAAHLRGADALVHLAWAIQPSRDLEAMWRTNVHGTRRVLEAARDAGVKAVVVASSVGSYSAGPKDRLVDESWPTHGVATSAYSRQKAYVERLLDIFEGDCPDIRVVRVRPGLVLKAGAASEIARLFLGPFAPPAILGRRLIPLVPSVDRLRFQVVHSLDVGDALIAACRRPVRGAFNLAAEPVLDPSALGGLLGARAIPVPAGLLRAAAAMSWRLRVQPTDPGWVDLILAVPLMDTTRARQELEWRPLRSATDAMADLLAGFREGAGLDTPPLAPDGVGVSHS